jgi:hypothetical protein
MTGGSLRSAEAVQVLGDGGCGDVRQLAVFVDPVLLGAFQQVDGEIDRCLSPLGFRGLAFLGFCFLHHVQTVPLVRVAVQNIRASGRSTGEAGQRSRLLDFGKVRCNNDPVFNSGAEPGRPSRPGEE